LLAEDGVVGIVLPDGLLNGEVFDHGIHRRRQLFGPRVQIEAVVSLPTVTFSLGGTTAKTSAVFLRKGVKHGLSVYVARADHIGYLRQAGAMVPDPHGDDLPAIAEAIEEHSKHPRGTSVGVVSREPFVAVVQREQLDRLDIGSFDLGAFEARESIRLGGGVRMQEFLKPIRRKRLPRSSGSCPFVSVLHVDDFGVVDWSAASKYQPATPGIVARAGDIIVSLLNPKKFRATVVLEKYPEIQCSSEFGVFEPKTDPYSVLALLQSPLVRAQLAPLGRGTSSSRRRIDYEDVLNVIVPQRDPQWFAETGAAVKQSLESIEIAQAELEIRYCSAVD
jgi:hypothetical protein